MEVVKYKNKRMSVVDKCLHLQGLGINDINDIKGFENI